MAALTWDKKAMARLIDEHNFETREKCRKLFKEKLFRPRYNMTLPQERQLAYDRLKRLCDAKLFSVRDFWTNPRNIFTAHEMAAQVDASFATKLTVQFNLFGGTVLKLGTERHHKGLLEAIDRFQQVGCFGLTELGYGNNAVEMETTATYDKKSNTFLIDTPSTKAQKYWITNGAIHAHWCVVFARMLLPSSTSKSGVVDEGIHGFLVQIRNLDAKVRPEIVFLKLNAPSK
jgi:acyl-CoA oxidase